MREPEPEIPSAMDDWDLEFERLTGALPPFSPLRRKAMIQQIMQLRYDFGVSIPDGGLERRNGEPIRIPRQTAFDAVQWSATFDAIWTGDLD